MSYRRNASVNYNVEVKIGGLSLVLFAAFGGNRSVHGILLGGGEWGPPVQIEAGNDSSEGFLGGALRLGKEVDIDWE